MSLPKPYYQDDAVTLYHGDCREILASIGPVDAVVTDPPYGETSLGWDRWPEGWPALLLPLTRSMWCFGSMRMFMDRIREFDGWKFSQDLVWEKHNGSGFGADRFRRVHEHANHFYNGSWSMVHKLPVTVRVREKDGKKAIMARHSKPAHYGETNKLSGYSYNGRRLMRSVIRAKSCHKRAIHPTQKPEAILAPLIEYSVPVGGLVLDPFMGSGSTLLVAAERGIRSIGIEADEAYCEAAAKRLSQSVMRLPIDNR